MVGLLLHLNGARVERAAGDSRLEFKLALVVAAAGIVAAIALVVQARAPGVVSTALAVGALVVLAAAAIALRAAERR
jgi:hypothetical protein